MDVVLPQPTVLIACSVPVAIVHQTVGVSGLGCLDSVIHSSNLPVYSQCTFIEPPAKATHHPGLFRNQKKKGQPISAHAPDFRKQHIWKGHTRKWQLTINRSDQLTINRSDQECYFLAFPPAHTSISLEKLYLAEEQLHLYNYTANSGNCTSIIILPIAPILPCSKAPRHHIFSSPAAHAPINSPVSSLKLPLHYTCTGTSHPPTNLLVHYIATQHPPTHLDPL